MWVRNVTDLVVTVDWGGGERTGSRIGRVAEGMKRNLDGCGIAKREGAGVRKEGLEEGEAVGKPGTFMG